MKLSTYGAWAPTPFDRAGYGADAERASWLVSPCFLNRDSGPLERANWKAALAELERVDPSAEGYEVDGFGHWACGWFDVVLARPNTAAAAALQRLADRLEVYPSLDDHALEQEEEREASEAWEAWGRTCWRDKLAQAFPMLDFYELEPEALDRLWDEAEGEREIGSSVVFWYGPAACRLTVAQCEAAGAVEAQQ
jgi:hypothetical protein